jgi:hypothetical protein
MRDFETLPSGSNALDEVSNTAINDAINNNNNFTQN